MKKNTSILLFLLIASFVTINAQQSVINENYGNRLRLGFGIGGYSGYYQYIGLPIGVLQLNYDFNVAQNLSIGLFSNFSTYTKSYHWADQNNLIKDYYYHETIIPIGLKASYYFDHFLKANAKWDFYLAGSAGYVSSFSSWDNGYKGNKDHFSKPDPLLLSIHLGSVYHIDNQLGIFLDISNTISTLGISIH